MSAAFVPKNVLPFDISLKTNEVFTFLVALRLTALVYFLLFRTKLGKAMRAYADNPDLLACQRDQHGSHRDLDMGNRGSAHGNRRSSAGAAGQSEAGARLPAAASALRCSHSRRPSGSPRAPSSGPSSWASARRQPSPLVRCSATFEVFTLGLWSPDVHISRPAISPGSPSSS